MKSVTRFLLSAGISLVSLQVMAEPVFTTKYPIGRVLTSKSEELYLGYYCVEHAQTTAGADMTNAKCTATQFAVSNSFGAKPDVLGNITQGVWTPIGIVFNEEEGLAFRKRMKENYPKAYSQVWEGLFDLSDDWQNEALKLSNKVFNDFVDAVKGYQNVKDLEALQQKMAKAEIETNQKAKLKAKAIGNWKVSYQNLGLDFGSFTISVRGNEFVIKYNITYENGDKDRVHRSLHANYSEANQSLTYDSENSQFTVQDPNVGRINFRIADNDGLITIQIDIPLDSFVFTGTRLE